MPKNAYFWAALSWTFLIVGLCFCTFSDIPQVSIANIDKLVHFAFHFVFVFLWYLYFSTNEKSPNSNIKTFIVLASFSFGISIELAQGILTKTRNADFLDVLANSTGAIIAIILIVCLEKFTNLLKNNK